MRVPNLEQRTPEWHKFREGKIGASYAPIIMGESPYKTKHELWLELVGLKEPEAETVAMTRGTLLEDQARLYFNMTHGKQMQPTVMQHDKHSWMFASLDGIDDAGFEIVEIKCPGAKTHAIALAGEVPKHYYAQIQHQLAVSGALCAYYYSYDGRDGIAIEVRPNAAYITRLIEEEAEFYDCVVSLRMPGNKEVNQLIDELREARAEMDQLKEREDAIQKEILSKTHGRAYQGNGARITHIEKLGGIDYGRVPQLAGVDLEQYRKPCSSYWRIST